MATLAQFYQAERFLEARVASRARVNAARFALPQILFGPQLDFATDPADFITGVCSRRAGKSTGAAAKLLKGNLDKPQAPSLYFTLTRGSAKRIIWPVLLRLNAKYDLGYEPNESDLVLKKNGEGRIYLTGADTRGEIEKWRGTAWGTVVGDEAQALPPFLKDAVEEVLEPSFLDHHGTLTLIGTPSPVPTGYFHECCTGADEDRAWSHHAWTCFDNPYLPDPKAYLAKVLKRRGVAADDPSILREFFGRWALDPNALVFRYDSKKNSFIELPELRGRWRYVIGVDFGHEDADAVALLAYNEYSPCTWLVEEWTQTKAGISPVMAKVMALRDRVGKANVTGIVCDPAGMGTKIVTEFQERFRVPAKAAEKTQKVGYIELLNDAMRSGRFFARADGLFAHDAMLVEWDKDKSTSDRRVVSDKFHSDVCFVSGTPVATSDGYRSVESVVPGTMVWTRRGLRPVTHARTTGTASVTTVELEDGRTITGTEDHPVWTQRGWVPLALLTLSDVCVTLGACDAQGRSAPRPLSREVFAADTTRRAGKGGFSLPSNDAVIGEKPRRWGGVARLGGVGQTRQPKAEELTSSTAEGTSIAQSGSPSMDPFRLTCIFTTATEIAGTTGWRTWSAFRRLLTFVITRLAVALRGPKDRESTSGMPWPERQLGTLPMRGDLGIGSTRGEPEMPSSLPRRNEPPGHRSLFGVKCVVANTSLGPPTGRCAVRRVTPAGYARVYALSVAEEHEYFANGVLVKNCDAALYAFRESLAWTAKPAPKTQEEQRAEMAAIVKRAGTPPTAEEMNAKARREMEEYAKEMGRREREQQRRDEADWGNW